MSRWLKALPVEKKPGPPMQLQTQEPKNIRRWEGAQTHRLNKDHWALANGWQGYSINDDIYADLSTLQARCVYEANNNPMVHGVIETYAGDIAGSNGPSLQVLSDSDEYNTAVEENWQEFFSMPDVSRRIDGASMIRLWVLQLCTVGYFVNQFARDDRTGDFSFALKLIDPRRLCTPAGVTNAPFGVELDESTGRPIRYHVKSAKALGVYGSYGPYNWEPIDASVIQHRFIALEPDQITGVPLLAPALPVIAELRDYDSEVMEAARSAASQAVFWAATGPNVDPIDVDEVLEIERGMQQTGPKGWTPSMLNPTQPAAVYVDFRHERLREVGRVINMPLMTVLLSSADQNFASANYDGQIYSRSVDARQGWLSRTTLNPIVDQIALETRLARGMMRPERVVYDWTWPVPPVADPKKAYEALRMRLEDGTATYDDVLKAFSLSMETVVSKRIRINELLESAGLPPLPVNRGRHQPMENQQPNNEQEVQNVET